ncbi:MAG: peptidylprolyl isomerase [Bryobacteraceae bacterium]|nr:peptidylprolyl isomerase [Bryobacteraceae bacterium]
MFDLFRSRKKSVQYLLGALLLLVALSMVITLVPGFGTGMDRNEQVLAKIGGTELTVREAQINLQSAIREGRIPNEVVEHYVPLYVNKMISDRALAYQAEKMGLQVTEEEVAKAIRTLLPQLFDANGKFVGRENYAAFLASLNLTIPEFEENLRKQMLVTKLQDLVLEGTVVTDEEVEREFRRTQEKVKLDYILIAPSKYKASVKVTPEEVKEFFAKTRESYQIPEKRSFRVLALDEATVSASLTVSDDELRRAYEAEKDRFRTPERVKVRHILLKTTEKPKEEVAKIRARAEELLKQIRAGADFAELAKKNSEDTASAVNGGAMDWITRGQTVPNFEKTAFSLKPKEISNVIETEYGFHIVQLLEKEEPKLRSFEEVKGELAQEAKRQIVFDRLQTTAEQAHDALAKTPNQPEAVAQKFGMKLASVEKAGQNDPIPEVGVSRELADAIFTAQKGAVTPIVQAAGNKLVFAVVTDIFPQRQAELSEVEQQVRDRLATEKAQQLVQQKTNEAAEKLKTANGDLQKLAKELGLEVKTTPEFTREGVAEGLAPASSVSEAFSRQVGEVFGPISVVPEGNAIIRVAAKIPADMTQLAAQREQIRNKLKSEKARERQELLEDSVVTQLTKDGEIKVNQNVMTRLVNSYRRS